MNATAHPFTPEEIMAFLDGELLADRSQSVSTHIEECPECRALADEMQHTSQNLSAWKTDVFPPAIESQVRGAAANGIVTKNSDLLQRIAFWSWGQWAGCVAAIGMVVVLLAIATTPESMRSSMRAHQSAAIGRQRKEQAEKTASSDSAPKLLEPLGLASATDRFRRSDGAPVSAAGDDKGELQNDTERKLIPKMTIPFAEATPGVAADSNGLVHGLGDHAEKAFSVDGQPISDQQSRVFSNPLIARTVSLSIVTKDFDGSHKSLDAILARHNGYAASLSVSTPQGAAKSIDASLRIPAPQLAATLTELRALGRVETEGQNGEEVTQQHADLVARLKNSRETELRLQDILRVRTGKISDILSVEQEIARVRGEIEQMETEQKNLEHRVDFATIDLKLSEEYKAQLSSPAPSVSTLLRNALINGLRTAADSVLSLVLFFSESGPVVLLWLAILAIPARQIWRRYRRAAAAI